jgi:type 1 fimbria pilin
MKLSKILSTSVAIGTLCFAGVSSAAFITGQIEFTGNSVVTGTSANFSVDFSDYTAIDFLLPGAESYTIAGAQALASNGTGDLASITLLDATMYDFNSTGLPVTPLWVTDDFSFSLTSLNVDLFTLTGTGAADSVTLSGQGMLSSTIGLDDTEYTWDYSSQGGLTFSANSTAVSEPSIVALMGFGLLGIAVFRFRKQKSA